MEDEIRISVNPESINAYVAQKIIESALGERLQETVEEALKQLGRYGNDPLKLSVQAEVNKQIMQLVATEYADRIKQAVREQMTDEWLASMVTGFMHNLITHVDRRY